MAVASRVACECSGFRAAGSFQVDGEWLVLHSPLGEHRVRLGISDPRKLAARLLKNVCKKAIANVPIAAACRCPDAEDRSKEVVDVQRDKIVAMAPDHPLRASEERLLDQMIETSRIGDAVGVCFDATGETEKAVLSVPPASLQRP